MQPTLMVVNFIYGILSILLMVGSVFFIDRITPSIDVAEELKRGNIAVAIAVAGFCIAVALVVSHAVA